MDYEKAKKAVQARKPRENYLLIKLDWETQLVLPHKAGLVFLESIGGAEMLRTSYNQPHRITELERGKFEVTTLSVEDYERYKIAALLNVTIDEVKQFEQGTPVSA